MIVLEEQKDLIVHHTWNICMSFHFFLPQFSSILLLILHPSALCLLILLLFLLLLYVPLQLLCRSLSFFCMYIFRSRVIKSAPAGMCWNRIFFISPCPHSTTETQICITTCISVNINTEMLGLYLFPFLLSHIDHMFSNMFVKFSFLSFLMQYNAYFITWNAYLDVISTYYRM